MSYRMIKKERIEGKLKLQESAVKLNRNPYNVYIKQLAPNEGAEVLYCNGENNNKALVNTNGFPWFTLKLDPVGNLMRSDQHHTVLQSGYDHVVSILEHLFQKYSGELDQMLTKHEAVKWQGIPCFSLEFKNPYFQYISYKVKDGESLEEICNRMKINEYMVLSLNAQIEDFDDDLEASQEIIIPNDYSPKMVIYIDQVRKIPLMMRIIDDKGIYEIYEYYDVEIDPDFPNGTFSDSNEAYDF